jgi:hypothetical protein
MGSARRAFFAADHIHEAAMGVIGFVLRVIPPNTGS